jgi:hypothetical protein
MQEDYFLYSSRHVESIYFGVGKKALIGKYKVSVDVYKKEGNSFDNWTLTLYVKGKVVRTWKKSGAAKYEWTYSLP